MHSSEFGLLGGWVGWRRMGGWIGGKMGWTVVWLEVVLVSAWIVRMIRRWVCTLLSLGKQRYISPHCSYVEPTWKSNSSLPACI